MRAGPRPRSLVCPDIKVQDGVMESGSAGVGRDAEIVFEGAGLGAGGGLEGGPPWGRVGAWYDGDAVGLVRPGFEEGRADERERWKEQAELGAVSLAPGAVGASPAVLGQRVDPGGGGFGVEGVKTGALRVGGGGE
jgi:hypothetical protein